MTKPCGEMYDFLTGATFSYELKSLKYILLGERSQTQSHTPYNSYLHKIPRPDKSIEMGSKLVPRELVGEGKWGAIT